ncbi:MAG: hypothetical protein F4086_14210 [Gemmatimonadetes bacterium]|nr:hypothetical protein [Gemmatimonadota bacterium]MYJ11463.1 hypothetical protein [Gemmatimonadota bacterium]
MSDQTEILRELVKNTRSMKRYLAVLIFFVLLVTIIPLMDRALPPQQGEEQPNEVAVSSDDGSPNSFVLKKDWTLGEQVDAFTGDLELYTARSPENEQGTYVSLYCSPRLPDIRASIWFTDTPMFSERYADYQHLRAKPGFLNLGNSLMISAQNPRSYRVSLSSLEGFLAIQDSLVVEINRNLGVIETLYFGGIEAATAYLRQNCQ